MQIIDLISASFSHMSYTSYAYFVFVVACVCFYYILPKNYRWISLLVGSCIFYLEASECNFKAIGLFVITISFSYISSFILEKYPQKIILLFLLVISICPLLLIKGNVFIISRIWKGNSLQIIVPLGVSFYSLQIYAYLFDIYKKKVLPQKNFFKYFLFISFFPQIMQGPIPRYNQLEKELFEGHSFNATRICRGSQLILWGLFLKFMIAERAAIVVNTIFENCELYLGIYALIAGILYSIQLYTDFLACVCISKGVSELFGIYLMDNFQCPYFLNIPVR